MRHKYPKCCTQAMIENSISRARFIQQEIEKRIEKYENNNKS